MNMQEGEMLRGQLVGKGRLGKRIIQQSPYSVFLCPTGDSQRGRPRRLTEYGMAPRAAGRRLGAALTHVTTGRMGGG